MSTIAIDNLNVIYDNDTNLVESPQSSSSSSLGATNTGKPRSSITMGDFVNCDRPEEMERENYATCKLEPIQTENKTSESPQEIEALLGRINFWQPINSRGILHMLVRVRYQQQQQTISSQPGRLITKRESFRLPIELPPTNSSSLIGSATNSRGNRKHIIRLSADDCSTISDKKMMANLSDQNQIIVGEPSATTTGSLMGQIEKNLVDLDAELSVAQFNLTGLNELVKKYLVLTLPSGKPIGCCQVIETEQLVSSELDNLPSIQVVQPTRDELLPPRLKETSAAG